MDQAYKEWRQDDPRYNRSEAWPASLFPAAEYRYFRDCGCLVCALAVMLRHFGIEEEVDEGLFNPWVLNERLIECGAFSPEADLELSDINRLYSLEYLGSVPYARAALIQVAEKGLPCLVTVPGDNSFAHFTTLLEVLHDDAVVYDPLCGEKKLSSYGRAYEIRVFDMSFERRRREGHAKREG